jgi:hypothetical protein
MMPSTLVYMFVRATEQHSVSTGIPSNSRTPPYPYDSSSVLSLPSCVSSCLFHAACSLLPLHPTSSSCAYVALCILLTQNSLLEVEKKYYADGEDAYSMKRDLTDLITQRDNEREQRAALHKVKRTKEGKVNEIKELEKKVLEMKVENK